MTSVSAAASLSAPHFPTRFSSPGTPAPLPRAHLPRGLCTCSCVCNRPRAHIVALANSLRSLLKCHRTEVLPDPFLKYLIASASLSPRLALVSVRAPSTWHYILHQFITRLPHWLRGLIQYLWQALTKCLWNSLVFSLCFLIYGLRTPGGQCSNYEQLCSCVTPQISCVLGEISHSCT